MTSTHRDLPVPDEALRAAVRFLNDGWTEHQYGVAGILAIASPVVAAVLSDIADRMDADGMVEAAVWLRVRAGEYGGGE